MELEGKRRVLKNVTLFTYRDSPLNHYQNENITVSQNTTNIINAVYFQKSHYYS